MLSENGISSAATCNELYNFKKETRQKLHCSRAVFARTLRIKERTLEKWEQGRGRPNDQAAALVLLVRKFPDTLERLEKLAAG
jgi:putative transcriptional regulator